MGFLELADPAVEPAGGRRSSGLKSREFYAKNRAFLNSEIRIVRIAYVRSTNHYSTGPEVHGIDYFCRIYDPRLDPPQGVPRLSPWHGGVGKLA